VRDAHFLETPRYIELNPVRAGICAHPEEWPRSSYRANAGLELAPPLLERPRVLEAFGGNLDEAPRRYREFVRDGYVSDRLAPG
jgi:putative transposase